MTLSKRPKTTKLELSLASSLQFGQTLAQEGVVVIGEDFSINVSATNTKLPKGFSIDLIHRDSPLSPFYNSSMTDSGRVQNAVLRSMSRANRFGQSSMAQASELVETDILPNDGNYLMKIFIGTPPVRRWAVADTGSNLIWFQCKPCPQPQCYRQKAPLFDPRSSSTYMSLSCRSLPCKALPRLYVQGQTYPRCGLSNVCTYFLSYADNSYTMGENWPQNQLVSAEMFCFPRRCLGVDTTTMDYSTRIPQDLLGLVKGVCR
ncbi:aspartic proteinase CDR1-like [Neltuma alba]|uniref:aspartic proteinase CDR1-like n=1 Tax=Neltuma alba TaxID=207710 RepID=UPI0010A3A0FF|nr:aspartic proteinase CDR1-like [Prosopis alba]